MGKHSKPGCIQMVIGFFAVIAVIIGLTACGAGYNAAHDHNSPTATDGKYTYHQWHWFQSPGNFQTIIYTCVGTEGYYETQDNQYPIVIVPQDPMCGFTGNVTLKTAR